MWQPPPIIIGLKTTGDTSGAEAVKDSLMQVEDAAKQTERELDVIEAKRRKAERETAASGKPGGLLGADVSGGIEKAGQELADNTGYGQEFRAVTAMVGADAAAIAGSFAAIGAAAVASYKLVSGTVQGYRQLMTDAAAAGQAINPQLAAEVERMESLLSPITGVIDTVGSAWDSTVKFFKDPVGELSGLNSVKEAMAAAAKATEKLNEERLKLARSNQSQIAQNYTFEAQELQRQEDLLVRISNLRKEMAGLEVQGARQEVEAARLRGGDVELAEANALAAELRANLGKLTDELAASKNSAEQAKSEVDLAIRAFQQAKEDGMAELDPAAFEALANGIDQAKAAAQTANQAVVDQQQIFEAAKTNLLRGAENELAKLDTESKQAINSAADKARTSIYETIKTEFDSIGSTTGTVKVAVQAAGEQTKQSIEAQGNATVAMLAQIMAGSEAVVARLNSQEARINQIFARLR